MYKIEWIYTGTINEPFIDGEKVSTHVVEYAEKANEIEGLITVMQKDIKSMYIQEGIGRSLCCDETWNSAIEQCETVIDEYLDKLI